MTEENRTYITHLKVTDVPWHRLTTAYGRGTDFPEHFAVLEQMGDLEPVKDSLYVSKPDSGEGSRREQPEPHGPFFGRGAAGLLCLHPSVLPRWR